MEEFRNADLQAIQNKNEKTPSKKKSDAVNFEASHEKPNCARRLFTCPDSSADTSNSAEKPRNSVRKSYKMGEIYKRLHDDVPEKAHNAEDDSLHLLLCAIAVKEEFVKEADSMAIRFSEIKPK